MLLNIVITAASYNVFFCVTRNGFRLLVLPGTFFGALDSRGAIKPTAMMLGLAIRDRKDHGRQNNQPKNLKSEILHLFSTFRGGSSVVLSSRSTSVADEPMVEYQACGPINEIFPNNWNKPEKSTIDVESSCRAIRTNNAAGIDHTRMKRNWFTGCKLHEAWPSQLPISF